MGFRVYATVHSTDSPGAKEMKMKAEFPEQMIVMQMNVTNDNEVNEVYGRVKTDLQSSDHQLWAVVNNAAISSFGPLEWGSLDTYRQLFEVNVFGTVRVTRVFLPLIKASKGVFIRGGQGGCSLNTLLRSKISKIPSPSVLRIYRTLSPHEARPHFRQFFLKFGNFVGNLR